MTGELYAVKIYAKERCASPGDLIIPGGAQFWLCDEGWGPTAMCSKDFKYLLVDEDKNSLLRLARKLKKTPHPWYIVPERFEVVRVRPVYKVCGYEEILSGQAL